MITLTNPIQVPNSLGGTTKASYDKIRIVNISCDPTAMTINAQVQIMVSIDATQPIIYGVLSIVATGNLSCTLQVPNLNFFRAINISGATTNTIQGWITTMQNSIEAGLVSVGAISGVQATGV